MMLFLQSFHISCFDALILNECKVVCRPYECPICAGAHVYKSLAVELIYFNKMITITYRTEVMPVLLSFNNALRHF